MIYGDVKTALAETLGAVPAELAPGGVHRQLPDAVVVPAIVVVPANPAVLLHETHAGNRGALTLARFDVMALATRFDTLAGQDQLDAMLDAAVAAIDSDRTLGGAVQSATAVQVADYGLVTYGAERYLGARLLVEVATR